jgi:hypothetical protein
VTLQREAIAATRPDVVVGSSWGGAVACALLVEGGWSGPTVLLAPAMGAVQDLIDPAGTPALLAALGAAAARAPIVLFHDPADPEVDARYSRALAEGSPATLHEAPGDGHRLRALLEAGRLLTAIEALARG